MPSASTGIWTIGHDPVRREPAVPAQELSSLNRKTGPEPVRLRSLEFCGAYVRGRVGSPWGWGSDAPCGPPWPGSAPRSGPGPERCCIDAEVVAVHLPHFLEA